MNATATKIPVMPVVHTIIGLLILFSGFFLPAPSLVVQPTEKLMALNLPQVDGGLLLSVTHTGMIVTMIFFGVVYLWTFVDIIWPSFFGVAALIFSGYAPAPKVLTMFVGNPTVAMVFILLMMSSAIIYSDVSGWLARYLLTRKFTHGRPWVLTATILFTTFICSFLGAIPTCLLMWPVIFRIFNATGFKKGDKYVSVLTVCICMMTLMAFASDAFKGGAFYILSNLMNLAANDPQLNAPIINLGAYLLFGVIVSVISIVLLLLLMRFILRIDVSRLAHLDPKILDGDSLPPMNSLQKLVIFDFFFYVAWMLLPSVIGTGNPVGAFLQRNSLAGSLVAVCLLTMVFFKGKRAINLSASNAKYPWAVYLMFAVAMLLGGAMTGPGTQVSQFMTAGLHRLFFGMNVFVLTVLVAVIGIVLTNFCNSVTLGIVLSPVLLSLAQAVGMPAAPLLVVFTYSVLIAACTPAGSVYSAALFGNTDWVDVSEMVRYTVIASAVILLVIIVVGIPLSNLLFA